MDRSILYVLAEPPDESVSGSERPSPREIRAFSRSGDVLWETTVGPRMESRSLEGPIAGVAVAPDGTFVVAAVALYALSPGDGRVLWRFRPHVDSMRAPSCSPMVPSSPAATIA